MSAPDDPKRLDPDELLRLHKLILEGDKPARETLAAMVFLPMLHTMGRNHPTETRGDILLHAVEEALTSYVNRPEQYDPSKRELFGYLIMSTEGDRLNLIDKRRRERGREVGLVTVGNLFDVDNAQVAAATRALARRQGRRVRPKRRA